MKTMYILALLMFPLTRATDLPDSECAAPGHYNERMLFSAISEELDISTIDRSKTKVEVLSIFPVSDVLANQFAKTDSKAGSGLKEKDYFDIYQDAHVLNLTAKYTYINAKGLRDVFIASSLLNDDECSVRFNGYLTLSRDF